MNTTTTTAPNTFAVKIGRITLSVTAKLTRNGVPFPGDKESRLLHNEYKVTVTSSNGETADFKFYDSHANLSKRTLNSDGLKGALSCFASDATTALNSRNVEEMMDELGMNTDSRKEYARASKIYDACVESSEKLEALGVSASKQFDLANKLND